MSADKDEMLEFGCSIERYIENEFSICREERQYVVFLYNILRKYRKPEKRNGVKDINDIFTACGIPKNATVEFVFYEAAFMRDFFERNRRLVLKKARKAEEILLNKSFSPSCKDVKEKESFNKRLIQYIAENFIGIHNPISLKQCEEVNLGHNKIKPERVGGLSREQINEVGMYARYMMNVKPDIAVIYKEEGQKNLLFIECKFDSDESAYRYGFKQRVIQWHVAKFLCENYLDQEGIVLSNQMENGKSCLVRFVRKKGEGSQGEIEISKLIKLNDDIFGDEKDGWEER